MTATKCHIKPGTHRKLKIYMHTVPSFGLTMLLYDMAFEINHHVLDESIW